MTEVVIRFRRRPASRPARTHAAPDSFDDEVEWPLGALPERREIGFWIEQPVDVIDPKPLDFAGGEHCEDPGMGIHFTGASSIRSPARLLMLKNRR